MIDSGCRSQVAVQVVDISSTGNGKGPREYQLTTADGQYVSVASLPKQWHASSTRPLAAVLERFDGTVFTVSAVGITCRTTDNPDEQLPTDVPGIPAMAGLTWYAAGFANACRDATTGRGTRARRRWVPWLRRIALAVVIGAFPAFLLAVAHHGSSMSVVLSVEAACTITAFAVLTWRTRHRPKAEPAIPGAAAPG
jgi:hypothetical protein